MCVAIMGKTNKHQAVNEIISSNFSFNCKIDLNGIKFILLHFTYTEMHTSENHLSYYRVEGTEKCVCDAT
jgi:hypothetical protein